MSHESESVSLGLLGVLAFSGTLPATRLAVPVFGGPVIGLGRALLAAILAAFLLRMKREPLPAREYWPRLAVVALGVVVGLPLFTSLALNYVTSAHSAVIVGLLPASTAVASVLRTGERPSIGFWLAALSGLVIVVGFAVANGAGQPQAADFLILLAVLAGALGYAEGGELARELGGWRVISWVLVLSAPILLPVVAFALIEHPVHPTLSAWLGFSYVSLVSAYLGFIPWYRALAMGGVAHISQLQLVQPAMALCWSALLLGEHIDSGTILASLLVLVSVAASLRMRVQRSVQDEEFD